MLSLLSEMQLILLLIFSVTAHLSTCLTFTFDIFLPLIWPQTLPGRRERTARGVLDASWATFYNLLTFLLPCHVNATGKTAMGSVYFFLKCVPLPSGPSALRRMWLSTPPSSSPTLTPVNAEIQHEMDRKLPFHWCYHPTGAVLGGKYPPICLVSGFWSSKVLLGTSSWDWNAAFVGVKQAEAVVQHWISLIYRLMLHFTQQSCVLQRTCTLYSCAVFLMVCSRAVFSPNAVDVRRDIRLLICMYLRALEEEVASPAVKQI